LVILGVQLCFRDFFSEIRGFIVKNWLYIYDSKYCPSLATTFSHLSSRIRIPRRKNWSSFEAIHDPIFYFFIRPEVLSQKVSQAVCHWSKQVIVRGSNVWRIRRVGKDFPFQRFQVCLDHFRNMGSSNVMLQNHFIVSLVVLRPFVFQCSAQTHQLLSIPIACDCFSRF